MPEIPQPQIKEDVSNFFSIKAGKESPPVLISVGSLLDLAQNSLDSLFSVPIHPLFKSSVPKSCEASKTQVGVKGLKRGLITYC